MKTERTLQSQIKHTFEAIGGRARKKPDMGNMLRFTKGYKQGAAPGGEPDYTLTIHGLGFYIEAKDADSGSDGLRFSFSNLEVKQRIFLDHYYDISWLWLWMGRSVRDKEYPLRAWLIYWPDYIKIEQKFLQAGMLSIPYSTPHQLDRREAGLSAVEQLKPFELEWFGHDVWRIPQLHPFWYSSSVVDSFGFREPDLTLESEVHIYGPKKGKPGRQSDSAD